MASKQGGASASTDARGAKSTGPGMPAVGLAQQMSTNVQQQQIQASASVKADEKDYEVLFRKQAKFYQLNRDEKVWEEKGAGSMKILRHSKSGKYKLLMHEEQVPKTVCDQWLNSECNLRTTKFSETAWSWFGQNCNETNTGTFAVKFMDAEIAIEFKAVIDKCLKDLTKDSPRSHETQEAKAKETLNEMNIMYADEDVQGATSSENHAQTSATLSAKPGSERGKQSIRKMAEVIVTVCKPRNRRKELQLEFGKGDIWFLNYILDRSGATECFKNKLEKKGLLVQRLEVKLNKSIEIHIQTESKDEDVETELRSVLFELSKEMSMNMQSVECKNEESLYVLYKKCKEHFPKVLLLQDGKNPLMLYLVGKESEVSGACGKVDTPVTGVMQKQKKGPQKLSRELGVTKADIFKCFQIGENLKKVYPEVELFLDDQNHIHVESMKDDCESIVANCCEEIEAIFQNGEELYEFSNEEILFLKKREVMEYVKTQVKEKHLLSINEVDGTLEITLFCEKKNQRESILRAIKQSIGQVDASLIEDIYLISDESFLKTLRNMFGDKFEFLSNQNLMATRDVKEKLMKHLETCISSVIETQTVLVPSEEIGRFCRKFHLDHWQKEHRVKVEESNGKWIVKGKMGAPKAFVTDFYQKIGLLKTCRHNLNEFQYENVKEGIVAEIERKYECTVDLKRNDVSGKLQKETDSKLQQMGWRNPDGYTVSVVQQHVEDVQCGLIVKVGSQNIVPKEMSGEKFTCKLQGIGPGRMETQMNVPYWKEGKCKECDIVQNFAKNILEMKGIDQVSFPLNLKSSCGMPQKKFIKSVLQAFNDLKELKQSPEIQHVVFCQPNKKDYQEAVKILCDKMKSLKSEQIPNTVSFRSSTKRLKVAIVKGNIAMSRCEIIVNNTSNDLYLQNGVVSANILKAAGVSLQTECNEKYPKGILCGGIATTGGHNLHCKYILHGALPTCGTKETKIFERFLEKCMEEACKVSAKSIAFPALGTGKLKYPRKWVAETMFNTVYTFWARKKDCSVELVEFCLYEKDYETVQAFEREEGKWQWPEIEEENSHDEDVDVSSEERFLLICTSESESTNKKAVDQILEKIGGARSKTSQSSDIKPELPQKRHAPQPPGKAQEQSHYQKKNGKLNSGPETYLGKDGKGNSQRDLITGNERDYESKRLIVRIKDQKLVEGGENTVKAEVQRQILEGKKVEHIVYPFNSEEYLLVVCLCKKDADCVLKNTVERELAFEVQKFMAEAVVNVEAKMSHQVVTVLTSKGYKMSDIAKHSGVTVKENNILFGSLQEIKAAQQFLIKVCKNQSQKLENKMFDRQNSKHDNFLTSNSPNESPQQEKVSTYIGSENFLEKQGQKPEKKKKMPELEEQEVDAEKENWPEFECKKWEFHALNYILPKVVEDSSVFEMYGKIIIQGSKETISNLDEQVLKIRKMKRKELFQEDAVLLEKQYGIPWMDPNTKGMLLKDGEKGFLLCSSLRELNELEKVLGIEKAQVSRTVDPKMKSQRCSLSDQKKTLVMELDTGIKVFVYTSMLDDVGTQSIVLDSEIQASAVSSYASYMFSVIGGGAATACRESGKKLKETEAFLSTADKLKNCTTIIHFVNPKKEKSVENMRQGIIATVQNCLKKAEEIKLSSIAFPPICTDICSLKICSQCYVDAVRHYAKSSGCLMEVHFVDSNGNNVKDIRQAFEDEAMALASLTEVRQPSPPQEILKCKIFVDYGDVMKSPVKAICCCEYLDKVTTTHGNLSQKIHNYYRKKNIEYDIFSKKKTFEFGDTVIMQPHTGFDIIHLWMPVAQSATNMMGKMKNKYFKQYSRCIQQMLQAADESGYPSLACTLFGAGVYVHNDAILNRYAKTMVESVQTFIPQKKHLREIRIVQRDEKECKILENYLFPIEIV